MRIPEIEVPPRVERGAKNVVGGPLEPCSYEPMTGFYRTGCCETGADDVGVHTVCIIVDEAFLAASKEAGNDLSTPQENFPGLQPGDRWCLCAARWREAFKAGCAPRVVLNSTHERTLDYVSLEDLKKHAIDLQ